VVIHGSNEQIRIIVVEGPAENHFTANKTVGYLEISGKQLKRDLLRGTEIDLTFELSESRDLTVHAYVNPSGPEFSQIFNPTFRDVPVRTLTEEVRMLDGQLEKEKAEAMENENFEVVEKLEKLAAPVQELQGEVMLLALDDVTDNRYKLEDRKRKIAQELSLLTSGKRVERLRNEYQTAKTEISAIVSESGNDHERRQLNELITQEHTFLNSSNPQKLQNAIDQLHRISFQILRRTPDFLIGWFQHLLGKRETFNDQLQAKNLIEAGKKHIATEDFDKLDEVNARLHNLLPQKEKDSNEMRHFTGIS
jgi:molecular chaperone DnaK